MSITHQMIVIALIVLLAAPVVCAAVGDPTTIGGFRKDCIDAQRTLPADPSQVIDIVGAVGHCVGYVSGLMDGMRITGGALDTALQTPAGSTLGTVLGICPPNWGLSAGQQIEMVDAYATRHNVGDDESTRSVFVAALRELFPCGGHQEDGK